ncbi:MAG: TetR/AcrR family transcriptional regulator [Hyphomicrobiales bacterium]|nr:TetR/AcrR family transcriptional regulator [Hyphomicrobiales bacterium]
MISTASRSGAQSAPRRRSAKAEAARVSGEKLLDAAVHVIRSKGYSAARVEDICAEAGLTKGAFFHHFPSKEACALAAASHFARRAEGLFEAAPYSRLADPRARVLGYVDFRKAILVGELPQFTCLLGTMVQEAYDTHPAIRAACDRYISEHAAHLKTDLAKAKARCAPKAGWAPQSAALFSQAVLQGAFILAKAKHGPKVAADCLDHLKLYFEALLPAPASSVGAVADRAAALNERGYRAPAPSGEAKSRRAKQKGAARP